MNHVAGTMALNYDPKVYSSAGILNVLEDLDVLVGDKHDAADERGCAGALVQGLDAAAGGRAAAACAAIGPSIPRIIAYWPVRAVDPAKIKTPTFAVGGWRDIFPGEAVPSVYARLDGPKNFLMGPWMHTMPETAVNEPIEFLL